jgi:hypothetical protein
VQERVFIWWQEMGGPSVLPPQRKGYGSVVLEKMSIQISTTARRKFHFRPSRLNMRRRNVLGALGSAGLRPPVRERLTAFTPGHCANSAFGISRTNFVGDQSSPTRPRKTSGLRMMVQRSRNSKMPRRCHSRMQRLTFSRVPPAISASSRCDSDSLAGPWPCAG